MSGICGIIQFNQQPVDPTVLQAMAETVAHRGPDGINYICQQAAGLAHLALHITPESVQEQQPLRSSDGSLWLTADARIDNRSELIAVLSAKGYLANPHATDADLILAAYRCWGHDCAAHLIGDFAFALWDANRRQLFAARDPMATRAFYYRYTPNQLLFGTEVKQLLAVPGVPTQIFEPMLGAWLAFHPGNADWTFYNGIKQLPARHALVADADGCRVWPYWDIDPNYRIRHRRGEDYAEEFRELFQEAVACRLRSIKPVGLFMSGGVDSGSVGAMAGKLVQDNPGQYPDFRAYSYAFETLTQCDERHISDPIAKHYGFPVTDIPAETAWPLKDFPDHGPDRDDPWMGCYQALHDLTLATAKAEGMGVMMTGSHGDLLVGGDIVDGLGMLAAGDLAGLWAELKAYSQWQGLSLPQVIRQHILRPARHTLWPSPRPAGQRPVTFADWVTPEFSQRIDPAHCYTPQPIPQRLAGARRRRYQILFDPVYARLGTWHERNFARFNLCCTDPWSDRRLLSFIMAIPQHRVTRLLASKCLARQAMAGVVPEPSRQQMGKIYPSELWRQALDHQVQDTIQDLIRDSCLGKQGCIDQSQLQQYFESTVVQGGDEHPSFWPTLMTEAWLRQYSLAKG